MAGASLLALLDDIATVLDDVALMTKVAAKKTAGVLGDDLALNVRQVSGVRAARELPVVWAVAIGSLKNKAILVPAALALSVLLPWAITPLLMIGGLYLCFEGCEKLVHRSLSRTKEDVPPRAEALTDLADEQADPAAIEADKIRGAIRTDFVLSAEIIVIALGTVAGRPFLMQAAVLVGIGLLMTVGVYGFVAAIVKLDDLGAWLLARHSRAAQRVGRFLLRAAPQLMRALTVIGTAAMFLIGGAILLHGVPPAQGALEHIGESAGRLDGLVTALLEAGVGLAAGALLLGGLQIAKRLTRRKKATS